MLLFLHDATVHKGTHTHAAFSRTSDKAWQLRLNFYSVCIGV